MARAIQLATQHSPTIRHIASAQDLPERFQAYYPRIRAEIESLERGRVQREGLQHELSKEQEGVSESKPSPPREKHQQSQPVNLIYASDIRLSYTLDLLWLFSLGSQFSIVPTNAMLPTKAINIDI